MAEKSDGALTYDKALQLAAPVAWVVLGLLGWSLDNQISDFKNKLNSVEASVGTIADQHSSLLVSMAEVKIRQQQNTDKLADLASVTRERGDQIERMSVTVGELLEDRRSEKKSLLDKAYNSKEHSQ